MRRRCLSPRVWCGGAFFLAARILPFWDFRAACVLDLFRRAIELPMTFAPRILQEDSLESKGFRSRWRLEYTRIGNLVLVSSNYRMLQMIHYTIPVLLMIYIYRLPVHSNQSYIVNGF